MQRRLIWSSNEAYLILGRMYLKLHRDASVTASGRIFGNSIGDYTGKTASKTIGIEPKKHLFTQCLLPFASKTPLKSPKTPKYRYFYGNIWQIMAIKKLLQYRYILIIKQLPNYMAIWQFFYEKT